jgi:beta-glucanase (GH16 family)
MEYWTEMNREDNYTGELQYYTPANSCIDNGCLTLTARKEAMGGHQYTSGMVQTFGKLEVLYGRIEAKISLPVAQGIFPAFWLTTDSDLHEIDVLEMVGCEPGNIYGVCHYKKNNRATKTYGMIHIIDPCEFHVYAVEWETDEVRWYVDDTQFFSTITGVPDEALYVILTLAVGGVWPGNPDQTTQLPLSMKVDYIRIYDWKTSGLGGTYDIS